MEARLGTMVLEGLGSQLMEMLSDTETSMALYYPEVEGPGAESWDSDTLLCLPLFNLVVNLSKLLLHFKLPQRYDVICCYCFDKLGLLPPCPPLNTQGPRCLDWLEA